MSTLTRSTTWASVGSLSFHALAAIAIYVCAIQQPSSHHLPLSHLAPTIQVQLVATSANVITPAAATTPANKQTLEKPSTASSFATPIKQIAPPKPDISNAKLSVANVTSPAASSTIAPVQALAPTAPHAAPSTPEMDATPNAQTSAEPTSIKAKPDYAFNPPPTYPFLLKEQGIGGVVWLKVWVNEEGKPSEIALKKGSGYRLLDEAALAAVEHWRFFPAKRGNDLIASWVEFPVRFNVET